MEASAKVDRDIANEIIEIDREFKVKYPKFLGDSIKRKHSVSAVELIAFMVKNFRETECFTFSNCHRQNLIFKCHRILASGLPAYKDNCLLPATEYTPKKLKEEKFVERDTFIMKSQSRGQEERFLYVLGPTEEDDQLYYGKVTFTKVQLSAITQELYRIRSKMATSSRKSSAVKERDFSLYRKELARVLSMIGKSFNSGVEEEIELNGENLSVLI